MNTDTKDLTLDELAGAAGGTVSELDELVSACASNPVLSGIIGKSAHVPGANYALAEAIAKLLNSNGIAADMSLGFGGTGLGSVKNRYINKATGQPMTHAEVCALLRAMAV